MTERELARGAARRLAIIRHAQEVTGNVSLTCRYFGITRQAYSIWLRRYQEYGLEGLRDRDGRCRRNATVRRTDGERGGHEGDHLGTVRAAGGAAAGGG